MATVTPGARLSLRDAAAWAVALFVFAIPFEEMVRVPAIGSLPRLIGFVALGIGVAALFRRHQIRLHVPPAFVIIAAMFVAWNVLTYFWSHAPSTTVRQVVTYAQLLVFIWLMAEFCRETPKLSRLLQAFVLGNYVAFGITAYHVLFSGVAGFRDVGRFDANDFATVLSLGIPMAALLVARGQAGVLRWLNLMYPVVAVLGVVLAASRGGLIVCLVALLVVPFSLVRLRLPQRLALLVATVAAVWFSFSLAPQLFPELYLNVERLAGTADEVAGGTMTGRTTIWMAMMSVFTESPLVGVGAGAAASVLADSTFGRPAQAHNAFISVAASTGLIGLLGFLALVAHGFGSAFLARSTLRPFLVVLAAALVVAMLPLNIEARKATWFVFGVLVLHRPILLSLGSSVPWLAGGRVRIP